MHLTESFQSHLTTLALQNFADRQPKGVRCCALVAIKSTTDGEVLGSISSEMEGADLKASPFLPIVQFTNIRSLISNLEQIP